MGQIISDKGRLRTHYMDYGYMYEGNCMCDTSLWLHVVHAFTYELLVYGHLPYCWLSLAISDTTHRVALAKKNLFHLLTETQYVGMVS